MPAAPFALTLPVSEAPIVFSPRQQSAMMKSSPSLSRLSTGSVLLLGFLCLISLLLLVIALLALTANSSIQNSLRGVAAERTVPQHLQYKPESQRQMAAAPSPSSYPPFSPSPSSGLVSFYHLCEPDHIGAQKSPRQPSSPPSSSSPSSSPSLAEQYLAFDGSGFAYVSADTWPSVSGGPIAGQRADAYHRLYVFEMSVDESAQRLSFNLMREFKETLNAPHVKYEFDYVKPELLYWWTRDSPDVLLECAHSYSANASLVEQTSPAFLLSDNLHCLYSKSLQYHDRVPTFTTLRIRSKRAAGEAPQYPVDVQSMASQGWQERWKAVPDFSLELRWCRVSRPAVFASAFVKPVFGEPRVVAERLLNFIHWHRIVGVDHFYVFDRYGEMIPAASQLVQEWRQRYANGSSNGQQWQFYSLADYINAGVVTYIPSPCQLADPNQRECARYADHLATGESGLMLGRAHAQWMLQQDIDEFLYLFPAMPRAGPKDSQPARTYTPYTPQQIIAAAQAGPSSGLYYPRQCGNSLYCPSPLRDWVEPLSQYGMILYRTWNHRTGREAFVRRSVERLEAEARADSGLAVSPLLSARHWYIDQFVYKEPVWQNAREKYICQPRHILDYGVHEARLWPHMHELYLMPDRGAYAVHFQEAEGSELPGNSIRDTTVAAVVDGVPAPPPLPLDCGDRRESSRTGRCAMEALS